MALLKKFRKGKRRRLLLHVFLFLLFGSYAYLYFYQILPFLFREGTFNVFEGGPYSYRGTPPPRDKCNGTTLRWLSFWDENHYNPEEFAGWANFGFSKNVSQIMKGHEAYAMKHILKVHGIFFERIPKSSAASPSSKKGALALRKDYQQRWGEAREKTIDNLVRTKAIMGFYMGDELIWQGLDLWELQEALKAIRDSYGWQVITWYNEAKGACRSGVDTHKNKHEFNKLPVELSWFSVDHYHFSAKNENYAKNVRLFYETWVYPKLHDHQSVLVIPGAFGSRKHKSCNMACYDKFCSRDAWEFYHWAWEDERVVAIAPYHWNSCPHCVKTKNEVGAKFLNKTREAWKEIGKRIIDSCK